MGQHAIIKGENMKNKIIISIIFLVALATIVFLVINNNKKITNTSSSNNNLSLTIYKCQNESQTIDTGTYQVANILTFNDEVLKRYQTGHYNTYSDNDYYNNTLNYLETQNIQLYDNIGNNTIYYYQDMDVTEFLNKVNLNNDDRNKIISLLNSEGYKCEEES